MTEQSAMPQSITEQILEEMLALLKANAVFDEQSVQKIKELASKRQLHKSPQVIKALQSSSIGEVTDETA